MKEYRELAEEDLLALLRGGDTACMEVLIERYRGMVKNQARALYLIGGDQEDLIQEGMIGLFKAIRDYSPAKAGSFSSFARLCVTRQHYSAIQASNRQKHTPLNTYVELSPALHEGQEGPLEQSPEEFFIAQESMNALGEKLRLQLSGFEKQVLDLYLDGASYQEIAEKLGKKPKAVDNALQRIRKKV